MSELKSRLLAFSFDDADVIFQKPLVMGVVNVTPDSFSDGACFERPDDALAHAIELIDAGADVLDIGGESTRPGAMPVSESEELSRVLPVIQAVRAHSSIAISVDTTKPAVMRAAIDAGANMVNDVSALRDAPSLAAIVDVQVPVCLMHMQGNPENMQLKPTYVGSVVTNIHQFFSQKITDCLEAGILRENLLIDPGFGFGKTVGHNLMIMRQLETFKQHRVPLMLGFSRKSTLGAIVKTTTDKLLSAGIALSVWAALQGVFMLRTHDVHETQQALDMLAAVIMQE